MAEGLFCAHEPERLRNMEMSAIRRVLDRTAELRKQGKTVIALSAGEPDFNTPEPVKQETIRAIAENRTHYGSNRGLPELRRIVSDRIYAETGVRYDPATELIFTTGAAEALNNTLLATVESGDEVIIPTPAFVSYRNIVRLCGGIPVEVPLSGENGFHPVPEEIEKAVTPHTRLLLLNSPNNPTGAVYTKEELRALAELAVRHGLLVLSDEIYSTLVYDSPFLSMCMFPGMKDRAVIINGFSKAYAMTGWRLGYAAAPKEIADRILKIHQYSSTCSPTFIQAGLISAMEKPETEKTVQEMASMFRRRRDLTVRMLEQYPSIRYVRPQGAFYVMASVADSGLTGEAFAQRLLDGQGVAVVPAVSLGTGEACRDWIRISFAASETDIAEGIHRIGSLMDEMKELRAGTDTGGSAGRK